MILQVGFQVIIQLIFFLLNWVPEVASGVGQVPPELLKVWQHLVHAQELEGVADRVSVGGDHLEGVGRVAAEGRWAHEQAGAEAPVVLWIV